MATIDDLQLLVERLQSDPAPDLQAFQLDMDALIATLPSDAQPLGHALRQAALEIAQFRPAAGGTEMPPELPPLPPEEPAVPEVATGPSTGAPAPLAYRDFLLVTALVYDAEGRVLSRHEVGNSQWLGFGGVRCRSYQIAVRMHTYPDGRTTLDLLKSNDVLVRPELLGRRFERALSPVSTISDAPVMRAGHAGPGKQLPFSVVIPDTLSDRESPEFENQAQCILHLASPVEGLVQPQLVARASDIAEESEQDMWLSDCCSLESLRVYPEAQRSFYLEPVWPGNGMPSSLEDFGVMLQSITWDLCAYLGHRLLICPTLKCDPDEQIWVSILGSPFQAAAGRAEGVAVFANLIPLELPDGTLLLNVEGEPTPMFYRWQKVRAVEAMGLILRR